MRGFALGVVLFILLLLSIVMGTVLASLAGTARLEGGNVDAAQNRSSCIGISRLASNAVQQSLLANSNQDLTTLVNSLSPYASKYNPALLTQAYPTFSFDELNKAQAFELVLRQVYPNPNAIPPEPLHKELIGGSILYDVVAYRRSFSLEVKGHPKKWNGFVCDQNHPCSTNCRSISTEVIDAVDPSQFATMSDRVLDSTLSVQAGVRFSMPSPGNLPAPQINESFDFSGLENYAVMSTITAPAPAALDADIRIINGVWYAKDPANAANFPGILIFSDHADAAGTSGSHSMGPVMPTPRANWGAAVKVSATKYPGFAADFSAYDYLTDVNQPAPAIGPSNEVNTAVISYDFDLAAGGTANRSPFPLGTLPQLADPFGGGSWDLPTMRFDVANFIALLNAGALPNGNSSIGGRFCPPDPPLPATPPACTSPNTKFNGLLYIGSVDGSTNILTVAHHNEFPYELCDFSLPAGAPGECGDPNQNTLARIIHFRHGDDLSTFDKDGLVIATNLGAAVEGDWNRGEAPFALIADRLAFLSNTVWVSSSASNVEYHGIFVSRYPAGTTADIEKVFGVIESGWPLGHGPKIFGAFVVVGNGLTAGGGAHMHEHLRDFPKATSHNNFNKIGRLAGPNLRMPYPARIASTLSFNE